MRASIIIPCRDAEATLDRCLAGLARQAQPPLEVLIIDNGSRDWTPIIARDWEASGKLPLRVLACPEPGVARARNAGAEEARGDWLVFLDSDCVPPPDWLARGMEALERDSDIVAMAGPAWGAPEGDLAARVLGLISLAAGEEPFVLAETDATGVAGFPAANLWIRRDVFQASGGFDPDWQGAGEDMELCARLLQAGHAIHYIPALRVQHLHASGLAPLLRKARFYAEAHGALFARHGNPGIVLEAPLLGRIVLPAPGDFGLWLQLTSTDKKALALALLGLAAPLPAALAGAGYLAWLAHTLRRRARLAWREFPEMQPGRGEALAMALLWILRDGAWSWGRIAGSRARRWLL